MAHAREMQAARTESERPSTEATMELLKESPQMRAK
jgi:hypothetical protein